MTNFQRLSSAAVLSLAASLFVDGCGSSKKPSSFNDTSLGDDAGGLGGTSGGLADGGSSGSLLDSGCATASADTQRAPVYMLIVLDGSGSMQDSGKWSAVVPALDAIFDQLLAEKDPAFGLGLAVFSDTLDTTCAKIFNMNALCKGPYPNVGVDVWPLAIVDQAQHDKLAARLSGSQPSGDTPTKAGLQGAFAALESYDPVPPLPAGGKKVVVLMTDGVPTDSSGAELASLADAEAKNTPPHGPVTTFAVGIGPFPTNNTQAYDPTVLGQIAAAGGAAPPGCNPMETSNIANVCHFQITPGGKSVQDLTNDFIQAINKIRSQAASCEFLLQKGGAVDPTQVNVIYTDQSGAEHVLVKDDSNGWSYDDPNDPTKVLLHGSDCDQVRNDQGGKVSIILGCKSITK